MAATDSKPLIVIIGSLNIDYVTITPRCPSAGETLNATSLTISAGGKGANQAVGCGKAAFVAPGRQDVEVQMVGAVGKNDVYVESLLKKMLKDSGVGYKGVTELDNDQTGTATIVVETAEGKGENRILFVAGANHSGMTNVEEIIGRVQEVSNKKDPEIVVMQGEIPQNSVFELLERFNAPNSKTKVVFNPAPVFPGGIPAQFTKNLEVLVVNETETMLLMQNWGEEDDAVRIDSIDLLQKQEVLQEVAKSFHKSRQVKTILITLGARGVFYSTSAGKKAGLVPGVKVEKVVDTTAAGDTFVGYFAAALARHAASGRTQEGFDVAQAVRQANAAAAECVQKPGAMQSIPFGYE